MFVLGIESSCDETACSIVKDGEHICSSVISSQSDLHDLYGGVFPELASRRHIEVLIPIIDAALKQANLAPQELTLIAVAHGPGLVGSLLVGLNAAKGLSLAWNRPLVGVNHVEAHLYAAMMGQKEIPLPALGVVISGGHTFLAKVEAIGSYSLIGTTVDDAIGEAFDKVATLLGLPYPGGPAIEELAKKGDAHKYGFKAGRVKERPFDFSFSGLKTNVLYTTRELGSCLEKEKPHIAASFQRAALGDIIDKSLKAARHFGCKALLLGGGVSSSQTLRCALHEANQGALPHEALPLYWPPPGLSLDNGAMIAGLGAHLFRLRGGDSLELDVATRLPLARAANLP